jgi:hypothetical protein
VQLPTKSDAEAWTQKYLDTWPKATRTLATQLIQRYGLPGDVGDRRIAWYGNAPWKRTVLYKEEVAHDFPSPHKDVLEQVVSYRVPPPKLGAVMQYNGSVGVNRTGGEISARCGSEMENIIVLNLVHDIVTDNRDVEQAKVYHAQLMRGIQTGDVDPYVTKLQFQPAARGTGDPGEIAPLLKHLKSEEGM